MAKKNGSNRKRKKSAVIPAEYCLKYALAGDGSDVYIDLMRDISAINRRGYNQGQIVQISHIELRQEGITTSSDLGVNVTVKRLPLTWVAAQAYMKAREAWLHQQKLVGSDYGHSAGGQTRIRPKYEDFKVYMDRGHRAGTTLPTLDGAGNAVVQGEWDYSKLVYADQAVDPEVVREPYLHMIGDDVSNTDVGIINAYEDSRATVSPTMPNVPAAASSNIYALLSSGQDDGAAQEVITNMEDDNDNPPYSLAHYPGGPVNYPTNVDSAYLATSTSNPIVRSGSMIAMCGLLRIFSQGKKVDGSGNVVDAQIPATMLVHLVQGPKKGLLTMNVGDLV